MKLIRPIIRSRTYWIIAFVVALFNLSNSIGSISFINPNLAFPVWPIIWESFAAILLYIILRVAISNLTEALR